MKLFRNKRNKDTDALVIKMMEDGVFTDIMEIKARNLIDDTLLLTYIERNLNHIDSIKWYLDILYPVSNKIVKYVLDNNIIELIPNVYTSYCDKRLKKMKLSAYEYKEIIKKFKGYGSIPKTIINEYIKQRYTTDNKHALSYIIDKVALELLTNTDINNDVIYTLNDIMILKEYHYMEYIKANGTDIRVFNYLGFKLDPFYQFCMNNTDIDLSLLNKDIIEDLRSFSITKKFKEIINQCLYSNIDNIRYFNDLLPTTITTTLMDYTCTISNIEYIPTELLNEDILYNFLYNGGLISDIPKSKHNLLNLILYKTAIVGNTINIGEIREEDKSIIYNDITIIDKLFKLDTFMINDNKDIILEMYYTLCSNSYSYRIYEQYPLLFRVHISSVMSRTQVESILLNNPRFIQYIPEYLITYRALSNCILNGATLNDLYQCKLNTSDIFTITRYNLQDLLLLDNNTFGEVIRVYWDSLKPRLV